MLDNRSLSLPHHPGHPVVTIRWHYSLLQLWLEYRVSISIAGRSMRHRDGTVCSVGILCPHALCGLRFPHSLKCNNWRTFFLGSPDFALGLAWRQVGESNLGHAVATPPSLMVLEGGSAHGCPSVPRYSRNVTRSLGKSLGSGQVGLTANSQQSSLPLLPLFNRWEGVGLELSPRTHGLHHLCRCLRR